MNSTELITGEGKTQDPEVEYLAELMKGTDDTQEKLTKSLDLIQDKDRELYSVISEIVTYLSTTYGDKYATKDAIFDTKTMMYAPTGKNITLFNALKYIQRYNTTGFAKSEQPQDVFKAIHYLIFELVRKKRNG